MTDTQRKTVVDRLMPAVAEYQTGEFHLAQELDRLEQVRRVTAPEAVVLYCNRILEALTTGALHAVGLEPSTNVFSNLGTLYQYNHVSAVTCCWGHALRRVGNVIRHVLRRVGSDEAELALLFAERWLEWFFCSFRHGQRLPALTQDAEPLGLGDATLGALLDTLEHLEEGKSEPLLPLHATRDQLLRTPELPAVLAELLLDQGRIAEAGEVLSTALARFPLDLRLRQLWGLSLSRAGRPEEAEAYLAELYERYGDDPETAGIMAGIYKRLWLRQRERSEWLERAERAYRRGWVSSRKTNTYPGINAAAIALWRGRPNESRVVAEEVARLVRVRAAALATHQGTAPLELEYWDQVALAEAELLLGRLATARKLYNAAFDFGALRPGRIDVTREQLSRNLLALGLAGDVKEFLAPRGRALHRPLFVGVTGHRVLPDADALRERTRAALEAICRAHGDGPPCLVALSNLAEGADRLLAELVLGPPFHGALHAVLPRERLDYQQDFGSEASVREFQKLLDQADNIVFPSPPAPSSKQSQGGNEGAPANSREAAYEWAGREVVDRCHVLVALWDGLPARGRGGTAEIVAYARQIGRPLVWVEFVPPYQIIEERMGQVPRRAAPGLEAE